MSTRHRGPFWTAVVLAAVVFLGAGAFALRAYSRTSGPAGAVKGYFAAVQRGDAPAALGFGALPVGPRTLLTDSVLRAQQQIAPISDVRIVSVQHSGRTARVAVTYSLGFSSGTRLVADSVPVVHRGRSWRLAQTAVLTQLVLHQATNRAAILGAAVPSTPVLLFPGAVPITFNTSLLQLAASANSVRLDGPAQTKLVVQVSASGRTSVLAAVNSALLACLTQGGTLLAKASCPLPSDRYVPGSLQGTFSSSAIATLTLGVNEQPSGVIEIDTGMNAGIKVKTTKYSVLDFNNQAVVKNGPLSLPLTAMIYPTTPLIVQWSGGNQ